MEQRKVAITGIGAVSPLGLTASDMWEGLKEGKCGLSEITAFDPVEFPCKIAGQAPEYKIRTYLPKHHRKAAKLMSRDIELAVMAADDAVRNSGLGTKHVEAEPKLVPERTTINIGAGLVTCDIEEMAPAVSASIEDGKFDMKKWGTDGMGLVTPLWLLKYLPNMLACHIGIIHDIQGPGNNITTGECAGAMSVIEAALTIKRDAADTALAGSGEGKVEPIALMRQILSGRASTKGNDMPQAASRPFANDASGAIFSEGAGMLVLEELNAAKSRNAKIYAKIAGMGESISISDDIVHLEADGKGLEIAITKAMEEAGITAEQIDLIIPHGTAIAQDDKAEAAAITAALGDAVSNIPVLPTKSMIGHTGTASASIDLVIASKAMEEGFIPAAKNCEQEFEGCKLNIVKKAVTKEIKYALCCSYTAGGQCVAIILEKEGN
ncbi:MAG: beta-ketoacyl-[acyl-carrier-protein] synthase family protein [Sedimentisphaeraceae bacterium JB056]